MDQVFMRSGESGGRARRPRRAVRSCFPRLEPLEDRLSPAIYHWGGGGGTPDLMNTANYWDNPGVPIVATDTLVLDAIAGPDPQKDATITANLPAGITVRTGGAYTGNVIVTGNAQLGSLTKDNPGGLAIADGFTLTVYAGSLGGGSVTGSGTFLVSSPPGGGGGAVSVDSPIDLQPSSFQIDAAVR